MTRIGEDVCQRLDVVPAQLRVLVTRRPKYACRRCSGAVVQAHAPEHVVPGGLPTEVLIAQVIVAKFGDENWIILCGLLISIASVPTAAPSQRPVGQRTRLACPGSVRAYSEDIFGDAGE
jgi:hypothetical protein